jgi:hypothetical protein
MVKKRRGFSGLWIMDSCADVYFTSLSEACRNMRDGEKERTRYKEYEIRNKEQKNLERGCFKGVG